MSGPGRIRRAVASSPTFRPLAQRTLSLLTEFGVNPISLMRSVGGLPRFAAEAMRFRSLSRDAGLATRIEYFHPVLSDYDGDAGVAGGHYFH